jgi:RHH-type proline utilization regulon transcriptional repressor/proline dehydrogenase/delta 1-pyrroline-5-carboxylate dehydrogenase
MRADDLEHAVAIVNQTGYGLTSGLESLDEREQAIWQERICAGNLYINRGTTGAIVLRQPFGGVGKSAFGPGIKAGGPNYVAQLMDFRDRTAAELAAAPLKGTTIAGAVNPSAAVPARERLQSLELDQLIETLRVRLHDQSDFSALPREDCERLCSSLMSYDDAKVREFGVEHDHFKLVGQDNIRRYRTVPRVRIRVHRDDTAFEILARVCAAKTVGCQIVVSSPDDSHSTLTLLGELARSWTPSIAMVVESDEQLAQVVRSQGTDRVRYAAPNRVPEVVLRAVGETGVYVARAEVVSEGRVELLWYLSEQSLSVDYHRYGNLGVRGDEPRRPVE